MNVNDDNKLTPTEQAEVFRRQAEMTIQRKSNKASTLQDLMKELGIPQKGQEK